MKYRTIFAVSGFAMSLSLLGGCSSSEQLHLKSCQEITHNLLGGGKISWGKHSRQQDEHELRIDLAFSTAEGQQGQASCRFGLEPDDDDSGYVPRGFRHVPEQVSINGKPVSQQRLVRATLEVTGQTIANNASAAMEKSREVADKAAGQVREFSREASRKLAGKGEALGEKAREAVSKAAGKLQDVLKKPE